MKNMKKLQYYSSFVHVFVWKIAMKKMKKTSNNSIFLRKIYMKKKEKNQNNSIFVYFFIIFLYLYEKNEKKTFKTTAFMCIFYFFKIKSL